MRKRDEGEAAFSLRLLKRGQSLSKVPAYVQESTTKRDRWREGRGGKLGKREGERGRGKIERGEESVFYAYSGKVN